MSHHPLKVTFPTDEAVYPLRLTGVDAEPIQLDLYVIGERRALAKGMRTWLCDTFSLKTDHHSLWSYVNISPAVFVGSKTRSLVGIPAVSAIMWPGCVLTRLHGRLDRDDMKSDLTLNWVEPRPVRATLYPRTGAMALSGCVSAIAFALAFAWSTRTAAKRGWRIGAMVRNRLLPTIVVALVAGAVAYSMLEVVPVKSKGREEIRSLLAPLWAHHSVLQQLEREPPALPFPEAYQMQLSDHLDPEAKREDFEALALPGDFRIEPAEDGWRLTILDSYFVPVSIPVNPNGSPCSVGD
jgi:hypothetical protein